MTYYFRGFESNNDYHENDYQENDCWTYRVKLGWDDVFNGESTKTMQGDTLLTIERDGQGVVYSRRLPMGTTVSYDLPDSQMKEEKRDMHVKIICECDTLRVVVSGSPNGSYDRNELIPDYSDGRFPTLSEMM
jgi:hypothetical protein